MKPSAPLNTQVVKRKSPMEFENIDGEFSIQSLLPEFARAYNNDTCTDNDQTRTICENDVGISHKQIGTDTESDLSTVNEQARTETENDVCTSHQKHPTGTQDVFALPSICNGQEPNGTMITYNVNTTQGQTEKWVIVLIKCKEGTRVNMNFGHNINRKNKPSTSETSCQTEEELAGEIKPSMVSVETQWDRDDFLPSLELVQRDHTYSNTKRVSKKKRS